MRIAFIGAGKVGCSLARYLGESGAADIAGFFSRSESSAREAVEFAGGEAFTALAEVAWAADVVFVTTPDGAIREVNLTIDGQELHIAIVNGLIHAKELIADIEAGKRFYHLVEVMTCQGGCVGGAGQPYGLTAVKRKRKQGLYDTDASALFKRAEKNPIVTTLLDKYGEERCHELLHVHYDA